MDVIKNNRKYAFNLRPALLSSGVMALGIYFYGYSALLQLFAFLLLLPVGAYLVMFSRLKRRAFITALALPLFYLLGLFFRTLSANGITLLDDSIAALPVFSVVRENIVSTLYSTMESEEAAFAVALLIGDTSGMDGDLLNNIQYGGVAHIFAVSGMNITEIYVLIQGLCRLLKTRREVRDVISAVLSIYYTGICGFAPSVLRAVIMCIMLSLSFYFSAKSDFLECTGAAGIITFCLDPLNLYDAGCVLSFLCCFGMGLYGARFDGFLKKIHINNDALRSGVAMMFAVNIATLPLFLDYFSYVSLWGLVLNLAFVPILTSVYTLLFALCIVAMLLPFAAYVILYIPALLLELIIKFFSLADFTLVSAGGFTFGAAKIPYYTATVIASDKANISLASRIILTAALLAATVLMIIFL